MKRELLLRVEDSFLLKGRGLVLAPDFSVPAFWDQERSETVLVRRPEGVEREFAASIQRMHFNLGRFDPDQAWRIQVALSSAAKNDAPVGCEVWCSSELCALLGPPTNRKQKA